MNSCRERVPQPHEPLALDRFFANLLEVYDLRFPYVAASMASLRRLTWDDDSPALTALKQRGHPLDYTPRTG